MLKIFRTITDQPLNHGRTIGAMADFAKWQISRRLFPCRVVYDWLPGAQLYISPGETGVTGNIYSGLDEFQEMAFLLHFLQPNDIFVDVGANSGSYTILAGSRGAEVYAFEPVPSTYNRLLENVRLNHFENRVTCINNGVGEDCGVIRFTSDKDTTNHALAEGEDCEGSIEVKITSLDAALQINPTIIKIDAEGLDLQVLKGARNILQKNSLKAIIVECGYSDGEAILEMMDEHGFTACGYNALERSINPYPRNHRKNVLFVREVSEVERRVKSAPYFKVKGRLI